MKVYHGTSADNLESILAHGFDGNRGEQLWNVSGGYNYFWSPDAMLRGKETDTHEDAITMAKSHAKQSAECALAKAKDCRRVVFEVEVLPDTVTEDNSCPNMHYAVCSESPIPPGQITAIWIDEEPLELLRGYFISIRMDKDLSCDLDLSPIERTIGELFSKSDDAGGEIFELLSEMELIEYHPN